jgi:hypothetical protein
MFHGTFKDLLLTVFPLHPRCQSQRMDCFRFSPSYLQHDQITRG